MPRSLCLECREVSYYYHVQMVDAQPDDEWIDRYFNGNGPDINTVHRIATCEKLRHLHPRLANEGWLVASMESPMGRYDDHYIGPVMESELEDKRTFGLWACAVQKLLHEDFKNLAATRLLLLKDLHPSKAQPHNKPPASSACAKVAALPETEYGPPQADDSLPF